MSNPGAYPFTEVPPPAYAQEINSREPSAPERAVAEKIWRRSFWALILTQFQGAFSLNAYQYFLVYIVLALAASHQQRDRLVPLIGLFFSIPFLLFSMAGGFLADRYSKRQIAVATKIMEIAAMALAVVALGTGNFPLQLAVAFLIATQAALFGPTKYGLLPEILPQKWLSWGNGVIELGTFLAIIGGMVSAPLLFTRFRGQAVYAGVFFLALAGLGLWSSLSIGKTPAAAPEKKFQPNFLTDLWLQIQLMRRDRTLLLAVIGNAYFWFLGSLFLQTVLVYGSDVFHLEPGGQTSVLQVATALGIGLGSAAAGYLSGKKIEYGLIPLGALGMTALAALIGGASHSFAGAVALLAELGGFAGFFAVPVNALIQHRPAPEEKGGIIAASNLLSFAGVAAASGVYYLLTVQGHLRPRGVFLAGSVITLAGTVYVLALLPDWFLRLILLGITRTLYHIRIIGRDHLPEKGGALFVCNHMSFVDVALLIASTDRPIRFLMFKDIYDIPFIKPFARIMGAIPISPELKPRDMIRSLRTASEAIRQGEIVCIFAEGQITRTGQMLPFRRGLERIIKGLDAPIVPINLHGVWGSIFSFEKNRFFWKLPHRIPYPVTVSFGEWLPPTSTAPRVRQAVQELATASFELEHKPRLTLDKALVRSARRNPLRFAAADGRTPKLRLGAMLVQTIFLARRLRPQWKVQEMVGVLLPPSVGGALVNYAATLLGLVPVNLNYTSNNDILASCARQCNLQTVVTSRAFLDRFPKIDIPGRAIYLEDVLESPGMVEKFMALFFACALPFALLKGVLRARPRTSEDLATIIFSSGSTGDPKGVMLTHYNVLSNIRQITQIFPLGAHDKVMGILPFFHSFGFTVTLWMPAEHGVGVVFHPNPLDAKSIEEMVARYRVTFLVSTPTFLQAYLRRCAAENFGSLQYVLVGAEKLPERVALAFEDKFGLRPLEGYGCTECSPVVAVNGPDFRAPGFRQVAARRGTIGHPLPGVAVRIVDPETLEILTSNQPGMLMVKGPNVMKGYLSRPEKTAEVLKDGWYITGDVASMGEDGFLTITDRITRFSKIGGEMVPHIKIEEKLHELAGATEQLFVVAAVADEKKGERIVVLHTLSPQKLEPVLEKLAKSDLPALWKPRANQFFRVDALPYLGTGKLDLRAAKAKAVEMAEA